MGVTIKDVADKAGVSIATVSHIINKTRYVSPELIERVNAVIEQTGYKKKLVEKETALPVGKQSVIAFVVPNISSTLYVSFAKALTNFFSKQGYLVGVYITDNDFLKEKNILWGLAANKRIGGIVLVPVSPHGGDYRKLKKSRIPFVCLDRCIDDNEIFCAVSENEQAGFVATQHLIKCGHNEIVLLVDDTKSIAMKKRINGYAQALEQNGIRVDEGYIISYANLEKGTFETAIYKLYENRRPTAIIAASNKLTLALMHALQNVGLECPRDVSVIGYGDSRWCELITPPLTVLRQSAELMAQTAAKKLLSIIKNEKYRPQLSQFPVELILRNSTRMIGKGPFGEEAVSPEQIKFSADERRKIRHGRFKVAISFHYSGNAWTHLHETAIRNTLESYGVRVISVTDAQFDPALQVTQLDAIAMQKPDLVIAIPADDKITAAKFAELSKTTKLVFISNIPHGFSKYNYASCVSVNERENGATLARIIGEYYSGKNAKIGLIQHGIPFYGTRLRDITVQQALEEQYKNIGIADIKQFDKIDDAYDACKKMILRNSDINAIAVTWDRPALAAMKALTELGREDIKVFTYDLDLQIAKYFANGKMVAGICSQRPYEQGEAVAFAAMKALIGEDKYKYIGVSPYAVHHSQLLRAWKDIFHENAPMELERAIEQ